MKFVVETIEPDRVILRDDSDTFLTLAFNSKNKEAIRSIEDGAFKHEQVFDITIEPLKAADYKAEPEPESEPPKAEEKEEPPKEEEKPATE